MPPDQNDRDVESQVGEELVGSSAHGLILPHLTTSLHRSLQISFLTAHRQGTEPKRVFLGMLAAVVASLASEETLAERRSATIFRDFRL